MFVFTILCIFPFGYLFYIKFLVSHSKFYIHILRLIFWMYVFIKYFI